MPACAPVASAIGSFPGSGPGSAAMGSTASAKDGDEDFANGLGGGSVEGSAPNREEGAVSGSPRTLLLQKDPSSRLPQASGAPKSYRDASSMEENKDVRFGTLDFLDLNPTVRFTKSECDTVSEYYKFALIGKFTYGKPTNQGSYVIKTKGPEGWTCAPEQLFTLSGRVVGAVSGDSCSHISGGPTNVNVKLSSPSGNVVSSVSTTSTGSYLFQNIIPGKYKISASRRDLNIGSQNHFHILPSLQETEEQPSPSMAIVTGIPAPAPALSKVDNSCNLKLSSLQAPAEADPGLNPKLNSPVTRALNL
ncbi:hypothetical protein OROMI_009203 [Orobanche minor]